MPVIPPHTSQLCKHCRRNNTFPSQAAATAAELVSAHAATSAPLAVGTTYAMPFGVQVQVRGRGLGVQVRGVDYGCRCR